MCGLSALEKVIRSNIQPAVLVNLALSEISELDLCRLGIVVDLDSLDESKGVDALAHDIRSALERCRCRCRD